MDGLLLVQLKFAQEFFKGNTCVGSVKVASTSHNMEVFFVAQTNLIKIMFTGLVDAYSL